jgi:hypothetical protein
MDQISGAKNNAINVFLRHRAVLKGHKQVLNKENMRFTLTIDIVALSSAILPSTKITSTTLSNSFTLFKHSSALYVL